MDALGGRAQRPHGHAVLQRPGRPVPEPRATCDLAFGGQPAKLGPQLLRRPNDQRLELVGGADLSRARAVADRQQHRSASRSGGPAARAVQPAISAAQNHHDPAGLELDPGHVGAGDGQHLVECSSGAHASAPPTWLRLAGQPRNLRRTARARPAHQAPCSPGSLTAQANHAGSACQPTHRRPRSTRKRWIAGR